MLKWRILSAGVVVAVAFLVVLFASGIMSPSIPPKSISVTSMTQIEIGLVITSSAFKNGERIPSKYTCEGEDISPPLAWSGSPNETKTFVLIVDDLDAPAGVFTHWVIFNVPATENGLQENIPASGTIPNGALQGTNDFGKIGYRGPCPPSGTHRYVFHLYSLDAQLGLPVGATKEEVVTAMKGHILAEAELTGLYVRG